MKLKLMVMCALFAAGVFASFALAEGGTHAKKAHGSCREVHILGTIAPQTLAVTVDKASSKALIPAGTQLSLAVGATGQTVRLKAEACATGTGSSLVLTVKQVELRPARVTTTRTGTTQTGTTSKKHEDEHGDRHGRKGGTTTTATTTTAPATTAGTTTTAP
ncbi:MAG: hypothetical protein ACXWYO_03320 [Gaiellaceae bacterium]